MKKIIPILFLALAMATGCSSAKEKTPQVPLQQQDENILFEYTAITRGAYNKIVVSSYDIITLKDRDKKDVVSNKITPEQWKALAGAYKNIKNVAGINELEVPSQKHQFDGAKAAILTITVGEKFYQSSTFDHGNPPSEIKPLVDEIIELSALDKK
jgi:hypothetical protein